MHTFLFTLPPSLSLSLFLSPLSPLFLQTFVKTHHKVGVLSVKQGQYSEEEIFGNLDEPGPFDDFLNVLGKYLPIEINDT